MNSLRPEYVARWRAIAEKKGLPPESYNPAVRRVEDPSGKSPFKFGVLNNSYRFERDNSPQSASACFLCDAVTEATQNPELQVAEGLEGYICVAQKFPGMREHSLALAQETRPNERPIYTTSNLNGLERELAKIFQFGAQTGWRMYHNGVGVGASIPGHEHWHMTNFHGHFEQAGPIGFEAAEHGSTIISPGTYQMRGYPFAHMIFEETEPDRIVAFLKRMHSSLGGRYGQGFVPHVLVQGQGKVLVVPAKQFREKGTGSGDIAGNIVVKTREEFEQATHASCINKLGEILYPEDELNLIRLL